MNVKANWHERADRLALTFKQKAHQALSSGNAHRASVLLGRAERVDLASAAKYEQGAAARRATLSDTRALRVDVRNFAKP